MKRVLLTIAYDGTAYHGWQVQPNGVTVQQTLQDGLEKILGTRVGVTGCSRTDAGVHAREFCCHFDYRDSHGWSMSVKDISKIGIYFSNANKIRGKASVCYLPPIYDSLDDGCLIADTRA